MALWHPIVSSLLENCVAIERATSQRVRRWDLAPQGLDTGLSRLMRRGAVGVTRRGTVVPGVQGAAGANGAARTDAMTLDLYPATCGGVEVGLYLSSRSA